MSCQSQLPLRQLALPQPALRCIQHARDQVGRALDRAGGAEFFANFREAWESADFIRYGINTVLICGGILAVQVTTMSLAAFAFARCRT